MSNFKLRSLCTEDLERVSDIENRVTGSPRRAFYEKHLALAATNPNGFITSAVEDGARLVGFGVARIQEGDFGSSDTVAVIGVLSVDPEAQGKGVGKTVLSGIELQMKSRGVKTLKTQIVWTDPAMTAFFSSAGFRLASSQIIERDTSLLEEIVAEVTPVIMDSKWQVHRDAGGNDYDRLARDKVFVRSFKSDDLGAVIRIDGKFTGFERPAYFAAKSREMLDESGIRVSVVAEDAGIVTGFIMARVDFGEFGKVETEAVMDTIGVHPAFKGIGVGHALLSQLLLNLSTLKVETVRTQVSWVNFEMQSFLYRCGFAPSQRLVLTKTVS